MKQTVKIIMTTLFAMICCFVMLLGIGFHFSIRESVAYDVNSMVVPRIEDVQVENLGDSFQGRTGRGVSYYKLSILMENPGNSLKENYNISFEYMDSSGENMERIFEVKDGLYTTSSGINVLPAGETGVITRVVQVDNGCKEFMLVTRYRTEEKQSFLVKL